MTSREKQFLLKTGKGKYATESKEVAVSFLIVASTISYRLFGVHIPEKYFDFINEINWESWDQVLTAIIFFILRNYFTSGKIVGFISPDSFLGRVFIKKSIGQQQEKIKFHDDVKSIEEAADFIQQGQQGEL